MRATCSDELLNFAGLVICLLWNLVAVTAAWIKGEGQLKRLAISVTCFSFFLYFDACVGPFLTRIGNLVLHLLFSVILIYSAWFNL